MGICISYEGALDDPAKVPEVLAFVRQWSEAMQWKVHEARERMSGTCFYEFGSNKVGPDTYQACAGSPGLIDEEISGLYVQPPGTETLIFLFDAKGSLAHYIEIPHQLLTNPTEGETYYVKSGNWVKTTGEIETHAAIVWLLRVLKKKYMSNLQVTDEAEYWETMDERKLERNHAFMSAAIGALRDNKELLQKVLKAAGDDSEIAEIIPRETKLQKPVKTKVPKKSARKPN